MRPEAILNQVIVEKTPYGERHLDIWSVLLKERIVFMGFPIDDQIANLIIAQLLHLEREDPDKDVQMYINSPGGSVTAGLAIYDTMQLLKCEISTICVGATYSFGTVLLAAGTRGKRYALPHSKVHMHQAWTRGIGGQAADIEIHAREIIRENQIIREILARHTGQSLEKITHDTDRDFFMDAQSAKEYGIIDEILVSPKMEALAAVQGSKE